MNPGRPARAAFHLEGPAREGQPALVEEGTVGVLAGHPQEDRGPVGHDPEPRFAFFEHFLRAVLLGHVSKDGESAGGRAVVPPEALVGHLVESRAAMGRRRKIPDRGGDRLAPARPAQDIAFSLLEEGEGPEQGLSDRLAAREPEEALHRPVPDRDPQVQVDRENAVRAGLEDPLRQFLGSRRRGRGEGVRG
jgi:hypothetical protein